MTNILFPIGDLKKYIPHGGIPFVIAEDGKENCGYTNHPRYIVVYYRPMQEYVSIKPIMKRSTIYRIPPYGLRVWVVDLQHYLLTLLKGEFENGYYLHFTNKNLFWFLTFDQVQDFRKGLYSYIADTNTINTLSHTKTMYHSFAKNFAKKGEELIYLLHTFRLFLVTERILRNDLYPTPNLYALKHGHRYENMINTLLTIDSQHGQAILQPFYITQSKEIFETWMNELKQLTTLKKIPKSFGDILQKGNQFFLSILNEYEQYYNKTES